MTKEELIERLKKLQDAVDQELAHIHADNLLLEFIGDEDVRAAFVGIDKWYS